MNTLHQEIDQLELYAQLYREYGVQGVDEALAKAAEAIKAAREKLAASPADPALLKQEPDDYATILSLRPAASKRMKAAIGDYPDKLLGALQCRMAGCTLGAIVEGWPVERMEKWAATCGDAFPPVDYWSKANSPENLRYGMSPEKAYTRGGLNGVPVDDDVTYTLLGLLIAEKYGVDFTTNDVGRAWIDWLPIACTAEDIALKNLKKGIPAMKAAELDNPFCQWIGADIRSDPWGYIAAGNPEKAASMAYQDAYLSHRRNGIYGEMYLSAAQAAAFAADSAEEALRAGLLEIPRDCLLARDVRWALDIAPKVKDWREARRLVDERFGNMSHVHTNNNMCLMIFGLILGGKDVTKVLGEVVAMGMDNDCTGASAGSIVGALVGAKNVPAHWTKHFNNKIRSYLTGFEWFAIDGLVRRFEAMHRKIV